MILYIKQKVFSWSDKFTIKDANGEDRYFVEGEIFSWGHKLHVFDAHGHEVAFIKQKLMTWLPKFEVYMNDNLAVEVIKEFSFFKPIYSLRGVDWIVNGEFLSHDYSIVNGNEQIATISKAWFTWGDSYELNFSDNVNEILLVATVLAIDCVLEAQSQSNTH
ncbi:MAG: hypothetical protein A2Y17_13720 [Clostridiales bacterium GWF2_38_85]|nr:MAG: hypothetical protein A2Y17_13720 [Clostridiales bacterium GWF2_38_85]